MLKPLANGRYTVVEHIGAGTFSDVWGVVDTRLEIERAVKVLRADVDPALGAQLGQEARVLARVSHPAIVHVYDVFEEELDGFTRTCVVMERCDESLGSRVVREGPLDEAVAVAWFDQLSDGLARAHQQGVVHRDVKPHNILIVEGEARLADFGLALFGSAIDVATRTSAVVGTVAFMSESVRKGEPHTPASDRYGLAASLAYAVTGTLPGDLLRRDNRLALPLSVRTRVEDWLDVHRRPSSSSWRRHPATPAAMMVAVGALVFVPAVNGFGTGSPTAAGADQAEPELGLCPTGLPAGRRQTYPARAAHARLPEEGVSLASGDFDGDGYVDLAVGFQLGAELRIWWGAPEGPDLDQPPLVVPADHRSQSLQSGDLNNDGRDELVWLPRRVAGIHWISLEGREVIPTVQTLSVPDFPTALLVADHTGDGCADVGFLRPLSQQLAVRPSDCRGDWTGQRDIPGRWARLAQLPSALMGIAVDGREWIPVAETTAPVRHGRRVHWWRDSANRLRALDGETRCRAAPDLEGTRGLRDSLFVDFNADGVEDWVGLRSCGYCTSSLDLRFGKPPAVAVEVDAVVLSED